MNEICDVCGLGECRREDSCFWKKVKAGTSKKKANNYDSSKKILEERGVVYREIIASSQLIIGDWNFWPSTGKFYNPKTGKKGRGVFNLLKKI